MTKQQVFEMMNKTIGFHLATIDNDMPRVRGMMLYRADENGIIFHTGTHKEIYNQVLKNPNAELCFNDEKQNIQIRASGKLEIVEDTALKDEIINHPSRAFLQGWKNSLPLADFYKAFIVFRLKNGKATVWTMQNNFGPKETIDL